tara:strand:- start:2374 stop:2964 length:591 start_codon:yes stop_codon:yes gene_type:complete
MMKKYSFLSLIILLSFCGGEDTESPQSTQIEESNIDSNIAEPNIDLLTAVQDDNLEVIKQHIEYGSNLNIQDEEFLNTPLNIASIFGKSEIAQLLVDNNADLNLQNIDNFSPLCNAAAWGNTSIVSTLLDAGADLSIKCFETQIGVSVAVGIAISAPYTDYVKSLYVDHAEKYNITYDEASIIDGREKVTELLRSR